MRRSASVELAETVDRDRAEYIKQYFDIEWPAQRFFQLMINFAMGGEVVVQTIVDSIVRFREACLACARNT